MEKEKHIWMSVRAGQKSALKELYELYYETLFQYGCKISSDAQLVEDAIQETFISLWRYGSSLTIPNSVRQYLLRAFRNHLITIIRKQVRTDLTEDPIRFDFDVSLESKLIEKERLDLLNTKIKQALSQLTGRQREIIYYRFFEDMSFEEIALLMNMQVRGTYKLMARALASLKQLLNPQIIQLFLSGFLIACIL